MILQHGEEIRLGGGLLSQLPKSLAGELAYLGIFVLDGLLERRDGLDGISSDIPE